MPIKKRNRGRAFGAPPLPALLDAGTSRSASPAPAASGASTSLGGASSSFSSDAPLSILTFALLIIPLNLIWAYAQELVGATAYGTCASPEDANCERFRSIPVMNLLQALLASAVAHACILWRGASFRRVGPMADLLPAALCHTVASPVGYLAMRFIPFPLYILVSSCKLIPVLLVGVLVNRGIRRGPQDYFSALIMTQGVLLYSGAKALEGGGAAAGRLARVDSFLGVPLGEAAAVALGVGLTLTNLFMEGFTNAWQDRLNKRHREAGRGAMPALQMMLDMNFLNFLALAVVLSAEWAWRGAASYLGEAAAFAGRHPEVVAHVCAFSVTGAVAQVFIFGCLETHGGFITTTICTTRKIMSVLVSVIFHGHRVGFVAAIGIFDVFAGLVAQIVFGGDFELIVRKRGKKEHQS